MKKLFLYCLFLLILSCSSKIQVGDAPIADESYIQASVQNDPNQENVNIKDWTQNGYKIHALARYELEAKVLSVKRYSFGREADLSPVDFALGWGPMSDADNLSKIRISQSGRWYFWSTDHFPIPRDQIESHSANTHIIPANRYIEMSLLKVSTGEVVRMRGYLVRVEGKDGWHWQSSLTRMDTGDGSCELFWVEKIERN